MQSTLNPQRRFIGLAGSPLSGVKEGSPSKSERNAADYRRRKNSKEWREVARELDHRLSFYSSKERGEILTYFESHCTPDEARTWLAAFREWGEGRGSYGPTGAIASSGDKYNNVPSGFKIEKISAARERNRIGEDGELVGAGGGRRHQMEGLGPDVSQDRDYHEDDAADRATPENKSIAWFNPSRDPDKPNNDRYTPEKTADDKPNPSAARKWRGAREGDDPKTVKARIARSDEELRIIALAEKLVAFVKNEQGAFFQCQICGTCFHAEKDFELPGKGIYVGIKEFGRAAKEPDFTLVSEPECGPLLQAMNHVRHDHPLRWTKKDVEHLISKWAPIRDETLSRFIPRGPAPRCLFCGQPFQSWNDAANHFLFGELGHFKQGKVLPHSGEQTVRSETKRRLRHRANLLETEEIIDSSSFICRWYCCRASDKSSFNELVLKNHKDKISDIIWMLFPDAESKIAIPGTE